MPQPSPDWISDEAKAYWNLLAPLLEANGSLTELDYGAFEDLVIAYGLKRQAARLLFEAGLTMKATGHDAGTEKRHPAALVWAQNEAIYRAGCERFGLTPLARGKMKTEAPEDEADGLLD